MTQKLKFEIETEETLLELEREINWRKESIEEELAGIKEIRKIINETKRELRPYEKEKMRCERLLKYVRRYGFAQISHEKIEPGMHVIVYDYDDEFLNPEHYIICRVLEVLQDSEDTEKGIMVDYRCILNGDLSGSKNEYFIAYEDENPWVIYLGVIDQVLDEIKA